ncbi:MAG: site-specific DNA-methyltransferase [Planctomycetota bacterium]
MYISIDEHEIGPLLFQCHQLFGKDNLEVLIWPKTNPRFDQNRVEKPYRDIKIIHEYIVVCFQNRAHTKLNTIMRPEFVKGRWMDTTANLETIVAELGTTSSAKDELNAIFGKRDAFQTPKPLRLIKELIRAASNAESIILDYFAGSGTTGHAVMELNREDMGKRSFILVNNNENNICMGITYERIKRAINMNKYSASLTYYKLNQSAGA